VSNGLIVGYKYDKNIMELYEKLKGPKIRPKSVEEMVVDDTIHPLIIIPQCIACKHFLYWDPMEIVAGEGHKCKAFPDPPGIPDEIYRGEIEHKEWHPEQKFEYFFEPKEAPEE
jgi:hypothetical protein